MALALADGSRRNRRRERAGRGTVDMLAKTYAVAERSPLSTLGPSPSSCLVSARGEKWTVAVGMPPALRLRPQLSVRHAAQGVDKNLVELVDANEAGAGELDVVDHKHGRGQA